MENERKNARKRKHDNKQTAKREQSRHEMDQDNVSANLQRGRICLVKCASDDVLIWIKSDRMEL